MIESINNMIAALSSLVAWLGTFAIDGNITFLDLGLWFLILRMVPVLMNLLSTLSKNHMYKNHGSIRNRG